MNVQFFHRDLSWLSFNERVLMESGHVNVPLLERIKFLSIFSSNLDEFYRVRMPVLMAVKKSDAVTNEINNPLLLAQQAIERHQQYFGKILTTQLIPLLKNENIYLVYKEPLPDIIKEATAAYFYETIAAFLQVVNIGDDKISFFSENNKLYQVVVNHAADGKEQVSLLIIPSGQIARFFSVTINLVQYIIFIDDIIHQMLPVIFPGLNIAGVYNIKVTRDADLNLEDEFTGDLAEKIESKISIRDFGAATRFLYEPGIPLRILHSLTSILQLSKATLVEGGKYHNLKDFADIPIRGESFSYPSWPAVIKDFVKQHQSLFDAIVEKDRMIHPPYHSYNAILRFFNEAAIQPSVTDVYVTLYRIANDSKIAHALITASLNGKNVIVFVELKARFDEANNIRWGKKMKEAGVKIIYSIPELKVHAKVALVKRIQGGKSQYLGLLSTGNLNEGTARFYTDHILLTANMDMLLELEDLFNFLSKKRKPAADDNLQLRNLLIAQFNLQKVFIELIDNEIANARQGLAAGIVIKVNNLEEKKLIGKLYEAAQAGVPVRLIVRSICCLQPGQQGVSENIVVTRIVDKYLEHGRLFIFNNNNNERMYLGSADWMNRNIYSRIEVCFPVYDEDIKLELKKIVDLQLADNTQAVFINENLENVPVQNNQPSTRSQEKIYQLIKETDVE